jgi:hypothetical protein
MDAADIDLAGYPANLKAGYRISSRIFWSKFIRLVKYEFNNKTNVIKAFFFKT